MMNKCYAKTFKGTGKRWRCVKCGFLIADITKLMTKSGNLRPHRKGAA